MTDESCFDAAFLFVMKWEGGAKLHHHPDDPGGLTKYGISQRAFPDVDIAALTETDARGLYITNYWLPVGGDELPGWLSLPVFDGAVNQGARRSARWMQQALDVGVDGIVGPITRRAAWNADARTTIVDYMARRALAYARGQEVFRRGWFRRLLDCTIEAGRLLPR